jgi:hypothetical protein
MFHLSYRFHFTQFPFLYILNTTYKLLSVVTTRLRVSLIYLSVILYSLLIIFYGRYL